MKNHRIFITGACGFVGRVLQRRLREAGAKIFNYDIASIDNHDIRDRHMVFKQMELFNPDIVIHLAAEAGLRRGEQFPELYFQTNVWGTQNVCDAARAFGVKKLIMFSSSSVYEDSEHALSVGESDEKPAGMYGRTKLLSEKIAEEAYDVAKGGMSVAIVRPFTIYGPDGRGDQVIYKFINQIRRGEQITKYGDGSSIRGYTHVDDICDAVMKLIEKDYDMVTLNIGGSEQVSLSRLIELFKSVLGDVQVKELPRPDCDVKSSYADIRPAQEWLQWSPSRDFDTEVKKIIQAELCQK